MRGRQQDAADDRRVERDGDGEADAHLLEAAASSVPKSENTATMTTAALVTTPAVLLMPCATASSVVMPRS